MKHSNTLINNNLISLITSDWISGEKKKSSMKTHPLQQSFQLKIQLQIYRSVLCREMVSRLKRQRKHIDCSHICLPYVSFLRQKCHTYLMHFYFHIPCLTPYFERIREGIHF